MVGKMSEDKARVLAQMNLALYRDVGPIAHMRRLFWELESVQHFSMK